MRNHFLRAAAGTAASGSASGHVTSNLILHLDASNYSSGSTWTDESGQGNNGTLTNGVTYSSDNDGVFVFDGTNDRVNLPAGSDFAYGTGDFTVEIWFNVTGTSPQTWGEIAFSQTVSGHNYLVVYTSSGSPVLKKPTFTYGDGGGSAIVSSTAYTEDTWYQCVVTRNGTALTMYLNNSVVATATVSYNFNNTTYAPTIGAYTHNNNHNLDGKISIVRVYKGKGFSASDVTQNWNASKDRFGYATGLITDGLLCNLDAENYSGSGDLTDSANSNDGTISGATFVSTSPKHFVMDGSNDYIGLGTQLNSSLAPNSEDNDASFSFWINLDAVNADQTIFSNPKKLSNIPFLLYYDISVYAAANNDQTGDIGAGSTNVLSVLMKDASTQYVMTTANNAVSANTWYNIVVVLNPSNDVHKIYLNNVLVAKYNSSVANNLSTITADLNIGAASDSSTMDGKFAQFLAYTKALTDAEVQQNWNTFKSRYGY